MKKMLVLFIALALGLASCVKQSPDEITADKWNGYEKFLKCGPVQKDLRDHNNSVIGKVTYGVDNDANFYVKYDCSSSGKQIAKTNMYCGDKKYMPVNEPDNCKEDRFNHRDDHGSGGVCEYTYHVPLTHLPPCDLPGFVVASHCKFIDHDGQCKDAWADGHHKFHDKGCGHYDDHYFDQDDHEYTILYGTSVSNDTLKLYQIDVTNGTSDLIFEEYVGGSGGTYDAAAFDTVSGNFFFVNVETGELWVNTLENKEASFLAGTLSGTPLSATFYNDAFYYVDDDVNAIKQVTFDANWNVSSVTTLSTIPNSVTVTDIAMSPSGSTMYILGDASSSGTQLITWDIATNIYYTTSIAVNPGSQIAFGSDSELYVISEVNTGDGSVAYMVDISTGTLTPIKDGVIIIEDPLSDISSGIIM